jgi:hypothetical protein
VAEEILDASRSTTVKSFRSLVALLAALGLSACYGLRPWLPADGDAEPGTDGAADSAADETVDLVPADGDPADCEETLGGDNAPEEVVPRALEDPEIDGNACEWPPFRYVLDTETAAIRFGPDQRPPPSDASLEFDLRWTETALFFAARMIDDATSLDSVLVWQDDSVELYVDGNNDDTVAEYDEDDHQYTVVRDLRFADHGAPIAPRALGVVVAVQELGTSFSIELAVPWSQLGGLPTDGDVIGIDVAFNDDDDGGDEETHLVWWLDHAMTDLGSPVQDTTLFRDMMLGGYF